MATTAFKGNPVHTIGELPQVGAAAPGFTVTGSDLGDITSADLPGRVVLNIFPSIDTGVCAASVRRFNELAAELEDTTVLCVSQDLPFAQKRFCGAEGIANVRVGSAFRSDFGEKLGLTQVDGPMKGLLARAVIVIDADGTVSHSQLVPEISQEPDYDAAVAALG
ncbi:MAG TPA: thiol peroxidase [Marmoricola sp.]|nr:thiol peroxidase [Marmoricola sp.]